MLYVYNPRYLNVYQNSCNLFVVLCDVWIWRADSSILVSARQSGSHTAGCLRQRLAAPHWALSAGGMCFVGCGRLVTRKYWETIVNTKIYFLIYLISWTIISQAHLITSNEKIKYQFREFFSYLFLCINIAVSWAAAFFLRPGYGLFIYKITLESSNIMVMVWQVICFKSKNFTKLKQAEIEGWLQRILKKFSFNTLSSLWKKRMRSTGKLVAELSKTLELWTWLVIAQVWIQAWTGTFISIVHLVRHWFFSLPVWISFPQRPYGPWRMVRV